MKTFNKFHKDKITFGYSLVFWSIIIILMILFVTFNITHSPAQEWSIKSVDYDDLFLRVTVNKDTKVNVQGFDITTKDGKLYRHIDGWTDPDTRLKTDALIFIRGKNWSLDNAWLSGNGHKEPLFPNNPKKLPVRNEDGSGIGSGSGSGSGSPVKAEKCNCCGCDKSNCSCDDDCMCKLDGCANKGKGSGDSPGPSSNDKPPKIDKGDNCDDDKNKYIPLPPPEEKKKPNSLDENFILYLSTGDELSKGIVFQVDSNGMVLGKISLPFTASSIASHRDNALIGTIPRDGGRIIKIDDTGKVGTVLDKTKGLPHPIRVAVEKNSDSIIVADDIMDALFVTTTAGLKPVQFRPGEKLSKMINPSVTIVEDGRVLFQENKQVSADVTSSGLWAIVQNPDKILINKGDTLVKTLILPNGKSFYKGGLMSWSGVGTLCVACQGQDNIPWLIMYDVEKEKIRTLFPWKNGELQSFVVAPRMRWDRKSPTNKNMKF